MKTCFNCAKIGSEFHGYIICEACKAKLKLFTLHSVQKIHSNNPLGFENEIYHRLEIIEKDYIKKRIKLLDMLEKSKI